MEKNLEFIDKAIEGYEAEICHVSDSVWDLSELSFREKESAKLLMEELEKHGFDITCPIADIPTAFSASYGSGHPVIGFLAEYDSLAGLSQMADTAEKIPVTEDGSGHGCGHHLLGAGCFGAAIAVRDYIEKNNLPGTVVFFGCPAEENGGGKIFMARSGAFNDVDIAISWHPDCVNAIQSGSTLANMSMRYVFTGKAAHAAGCPHLGRSALDAVELMNVGCNYLREHIIPSARLHYAITDTGGKVTNIVQAHAESVYLIRAPKNEQVAEIAERVNNVARGAALMTGTEVEIIFKKACSYFIPNDVVSESLYNAMEMIPLPDYTEEDYEYAKRFVDTFSGEDDGTPRELLRRRIKPYKPSGDIMFGSTDVADVSMNCPTAWFFGAAYALGTPFHSWQMVAQGKSSIAHKGLLYASKVMALTATEFLTNPEKVRLAKEAFLEKRGPKEYVCPVPAHIAPVCKANSVTLSKADMIETALWAENAYVGVDVGKLDQSCEIYSKKDHLLFLDTKDDSFELIPKPDNMKPFEFAVIFSGVERTLAGSAFNMRVDELKAASYALKSFAGLDYGRFADSRLRDVPAEVFYKYKDKLPENWKKRAEHYYTEFERVKAGADAWRAGDIETFGKLSSESGYSSIYNYETGSDELKTIYEIMLKTDGVYGGRFSGAGFKGCCMAIIDPAFRSEIKSRITAEYLEKFPQYRETFSVHFCQSADGVE